MAGRPGLADLVARSPQTRAAVVFAQRQHEDQRSADGSPYIRHPVEVARLLLDAGAPDHLIAAGVLHDTVEKTATDIVELRARFGPSVACLVLAVTEDAGIRGYAARKQALRERVAASGRDALILFAADKVSKARELRRLLRRSARPSGANRKLAHYRRCAELLTERLADHPLVLALNAELARLPMTVRERPALAFGVYGEVLEPGRVRVGDAVEAG